MRLALLLAFLVAGLAPPAAGQSAPTAAAWREDLAHLTREIERRHADAFHRTDRAAFTATAAELSRRIPDLAAHEIVVGMARLVATIGDAHTYVALPDEGPHAFRRYPIRMERLADGVFVTAADSAHADLVGSRVVAIGGTPIEEAWRRVEPVVSRDNPMTLRYLVPFRLAIPEVLHAVGVIPVAGAADFAIERGGARETVRLDPVPAPVALAPDVEVGGEPPANLFWKDPERPYWFESVPGHGAVYLQFNAVRDDPDDPFGDFVGRLEARLAEPGVERLVVDLRRNTGGGWDMTIPLVRALVRTGFDRPGRLYVLTGPATISAATVFAVELGRWLAPTYVGLPTGSSPNQYGEIVFFELPNSGVEVGYAAAFFQTAGYKSAEPWIAPDVAVDVPSADVFARRDPVLLEALGHQPAEPLDVVLARALEEGGVDEALAVYDRYRADPRHAYRDTERTLRSLGDGLVEAERFDEALRVHRLNAEIHAERSRAWFGLAEALESAGREAEAREAYAESLERLPDDPSLYPALGIVIERLLRERLDRGID